MITLEELLTGRRSLKLDTIEYKSLPITDDDEGSIFCEDKLEVIVEEDIRAIFERRVYTDTNELFDINIRCFLNLELKEDVKISEHISIEELQELIEEEYASECLSTVSLIISQITSAFGMAPIITPPIFTPSKNN